MAKETVEDVFAIFESSKFSKYDIEFVKTLFIELNKFDKFTMENFKILEENVKHFWGVVTPTNLVLLSSLKKVKEGKLDDETFVKLCERVDYNGQFIILEDDGDEPIPNLTDYLSLYLLKGMAISFEGVEPLVEFSYDELVKTYISMMFNLHIKDMEAGNDDGFSERLLELVKYFDAHFGTVADIMLITLAYIAYLLYNHEDRPK